MLCGSALPSPRHMRQPLYSEYQSGWSIGCRGNPEIMFTINLVQLTAAKSMERVILYKMKKCHDLDLCKHLCFKRSILIFFVPPPYKIRTVTHLRKIVTVIIRKLMAQEWKCWPLEFCRYVSS